MASLHWEVRWISHSHKGTEGGARTPGRAGGADLLEHPRGRATQTVTLTKTVLLAGLGPVEGTGKVKAGFFLLPR